MTISTDWLTELRNDPEITRRVEYQQRAAQQEYLRLKERLSPLGYSELALRSMAQSYGGPVLPYVNGDLKLTHHVTNSGEPCEFSQAS